MAELGLAAIPAVVATLVAVLVALRWRRRRSEVPAPFDAAADGDVSPADDDDTGPSAPHQEPADHELTVMRLLVRSLEELVAEQTDEIDRLRSESLLPSARTGVSAVLGGPSAAGSPAADAAVVRQALSGLSGPDAESRVAAALAVLEAPRTFTRPLVATLSAATSTPRTAYVAGPPDLATPSPAASPAPSLVAPPAAPQHRPVTDDVPTREDLPRTPPAPAQPERVLPVPAPPAPAAPSRRRLFRSRAA